MLGRKECSNQWLCNEIVLPTGHILIQERNFLPGYVTVTLKLDDLHVASKLNYLQS